MSRDVYSLRIFAVGGLVAATGIVGPIVPNGFVYVVRDIDAFETTGGAAGFALLSQVAVPVQFFVSPGGAGAVQNHSWRGRQIYNTGERVGFEAASGSWNISCSGYQLTLP